MSSENTKEDLGVKFGTPEEIEWTKIKKAQEETIFNSKINIEISEILLKYAEKRIAEEKKKLKPKEKKPGCVG